LWIDYKGDDKFADFIQYNDLGLPLAYAISGGIVESTPIAEGFVNETFDIFLEGLGIDDTGFETLDDIMVLGEE
jgi:hypothetical protein